MFINLLLSLLLTTTIAETVPSSSSSTVKSFMSDKTEVEVDLEVSGAEDLCETDDGYVWIAQYSGLTRYDSRDYVTYKSFDQDGQKYEIINVRALAAKGSTLYIATYRNLFVYKDYEFSYIDVNAGAIKDIVLDEVTINGVNLPDGAKTTDGEILLNVFNLETKKADIQRAVQIRAA